MVDDPTARLVITTYNLEQKYQVNLKNLKACKAAQLESCAKLLGLAPRDAEDKKLYQNLGILSDRIILKIDALFEIDCDDYNETDRNKLARTSPLSTVGCAYKAPTTREALQKRLFRLTVPQVTLHHAPPKVRSLGTRRNKSTREKYTLKRRRRKLNAQISALRQENPSL